MTINLANLLVGISLLSGCGGPSPSPTLSPTLAEGKRLYDQSCASCHLSSGEGKPGIGPPLIGCDWVTGSPERLVKISLYGIRGPIEVNGQEFNLEMPGVYYYQFDDEQMAAVLSYIRHAWGNNASPISEELVTEVREANGQRDSWTVDELKEVD